MKHKKSRHMPFRVRTPWQDNVLSLAAILSLLLLTLFAVVLVFRLLSMSGILSRDIFTPPPDTAIDTEAPSVYDKLLPETEAAAPNTDAFREDTYLAFSGDFAILRALLTDADIADHYFAEYETVLYTGEAEARTSVCIYVSGDKFRIERNPNIPSAAAPAELYVCDGTEVSFTDAATGQIRRFPVTQAFDMASLAGIPSVASFTQTDPGDTTEIAYTALGETVTYRITFWVPVGDGTFIRQEYWISPTEEFVLRCRTYEAKTPEEADEARVLYSFTRKSVRALTTREESTRFVLPALPEEASS